MGILSVSDSINDSGRDWFKYFKINRGSLNKQTTPQKQTKPHPKHNKQLRNTILKEREKCFYLTTHSTHFIYGYLASGIWLRTILIARKETRCRHMGYSFRLAARVLLYAPSHRQDSTYHSLCYTSHGALAGTRNSSMGPPHEGSIRRPIAPWANALTIPEVSVLMWTSPLTLLLWTDIMVHAYRNIYNRYITVAAKTNNCGNNNINDNIIITGDSKKNNLLVKGGGGRNVLFNDTLNTFYLLLYAVRHM